MDELEINERGGAQSALYKTYSGIPVECIQGLLYKAPILAKREKLAVLLHNITALKPRDGETPDWFRLICLCNDSLQLAIDVYLIELNIQPGRGLLDVPCVVWDSIATTRYYANIKYGEDNWKLIDYKSHLDHAIAHIHKDTKGDTSEKHLDNVLCRILLAIGVIQIELNKVQADND